MQNKKQILTLVLSVLLSVFLVVEVAKATITLSGTTVTAGTSGTPLSLAANATRTVSTYSTSALTTGAVNTMTVSQTMTAASTANQIEVAQFILTANVKTGAWANAILGKIDYSASGLAHGLAGVICAELDLPSTTAVVRGEYALYEAEINCPTNCSMGGNPIHVFEINSWGGGKAQTDTVGYLFDFGGFTPAADKIISLTSQTVRSKVGTATRYMVLSQMQDGLGLGNSTTAMDLGTTATAKAVEIYTTSGSTSSTSVEPFYMKNVMTGTGGRGGRARFHTYTNAVTGSWVNALKGYMEFGSSGRVTGLASAIVAEMTLPNATLTGGAYYPLEIEMIPGASTVTYESLTGNNVGFIYAAASGTLTDFDDNGFFMSVQGLTAGAGHLLSANSQSLKVGVGTATRYMVLSQAEDSLSLSGTATGITLENTTIGFSAGASSTIAWTGANEWMRIFLDNQDQTPGASAVAMILTNTGDITAGGAGGNSDQIVLELKNTLATDTDFTGDNDDHFTGLRTYARLKGDVTGGQVQSIFAELASHTGLTLSSQLMRTAYFYTRLQSDPGAGHVSTLELENACGATAGANQEYLDSHISFIGGNSQFLFEFGPTQDRTSWNGSAVGDESDAGAGWLKVKVGGATRYIRLFAAP